MIRPRRLERRLDAALAPVVAKVEEVGAKVDDRSHHDEILAANVARVDARIEAVHEQSAARLAAVNAELAEISRESVRSGIADLTSRIKIAEDGRQAQSDRADALASEVEHLRSEVERLTIERDEARRQHDEMRAERWDDIAYGRLKWAQAAEARHLALADAARAVLGDLAEGLPHRPHGGSRTRARRRMEALAALVEASQEAIEWTGDKSYVVRSLAALVEPTADST